MKINKISVVALLAAGGLLAATPVLRAQETPPNTNVPGMMPRVNSGNRLDKLAADLNLTDDQKSQVAAVFEENRKNMRQISQDTNLTVEEKKAKRSDLRQQLVASMKSILTPGQFEKWQNLMHRRRPLSPAGTNAPSSDLSTH